MQVETAKRLFTVDEYYRMAEVGILGPEDRVELIDGEIFEMSPIGNRHLACVNRANRLFLTAFANRVVVSIQHPLQLSNYTEPEPAALNFLATQRPEFLRFGSKILSTMFCSSIAIPSATGSRQNLLFAVVSPFRQSRFRMRYSRLTNSWFDLN